MSPETLVALKVLPSISVRLSTLRGSSDLEGEARLQVRRRNFDQFFVRNCQVRAHACLATLLLMRYHRQRRS